MAFEQAVIKVEKEREFGELKDAIKKVFAPERVEKYLRELGKRGIRVRDLDSALAKCAIERASGEKAGSAKSLYEQLSVSDRAQLREFYLSQLEEVDPALRQEFQKIYQYY
jgi:predicted trehalose synthase